jgi:hypothetical protein
MQWTDIFPNQPHGLNSFPPTGGSIWPVRVRRAPLHSLPAPATDRANPRNFRTRNRHSALSFLARAWLRVPAYVSIPSPFLFLRIGVH